MPYVSNWMIVTALKKGEKNKNLMTITFMVQADQSICCKRSHLSYILFPFYKYRKKKFKNLNAAAFFFIIFLNIFFFENNYFPKH
jgi:hypothetical protein